PFGRWAAASAQVELFVQLLAAELTAPSADPDRAAALRARATAAEAELAAVTEEPRRVTPERAAVLAPPPVAAGEVAALLPSGGVLVSHLLVDDDLLTWAVDGGGLVVASVQRIEARQLAQAVTRFSVGCATGGTWVEDGRVAADILLGPVDDV